mgnify:CR=1 FL=1
MSITKILADKDTPASEKLERVAEIVSSARAAYGNEDATIASPMINTTQGNMNFNHLEDDAKVAILRGEVASIKAKAVEFVEQREGASFNRKIEELLATNGMFTNVSSGTKFEYI